MWGEGYLFSMIPARCRKLFLFSFSQIWDVLGSRLQRGTENPTVNCLLEQLMSGDLTDFIIVMITVFVVSLGMLWKQQARARKQVSPSLLQYGKTVVPVCEQTRLCQLQHRFVTGLSEQKE